ncbi:hypothetical protein [Tenacibaculum jejuense]|uniref:hypothetical protein n=1 Tax=Tenacibaculum jejuense TaxID=584609 RepID=UPI0012FE20C4|nr:hypothetical protein [Tenacibaculum jejuense]
MIEKKSQENNFFIDYNIELIANLYFEGDKTRLAEFFYNNINSLETIEKVDVLLENNFPLLFLFKLLSKRMTEASGIVDLIKLSSDKKLQDLVSEIPKEHWNVFDDFYLKNKESFRNFFLSELKILNLEEEIIKKKLFSTNKTNIASEFGVDIKTLNKWLNILFNDRFKGVRKIYYDDYIEIFKALFLAKGEKLDFSKNINIYRKRLSKGLKHRKKDIVKYTNEGSSLDVSTLLKIQKEELSKNNYYLFTDVFPYSITKLLVEELGDEMEF